jgi:pheromone shutdown protein TraB
MNSHRQSLISFQVMNACSSYITTCIQVFMAWFLHTDIFSLIAVKISNTLAAEFNFAVTPADGLGGAKRKSPLSLSVLLSLQG